MLFVAFDDTDSLKGMCTTFLATEMIREFSDLDLIGYPRLVRLNPNVPWKTRGNGALCLRFGRGRGGRLKAGEMAGKEVHAWSRCQDVPDARKVLKRAARVLERWAEFDDELTNPAVAVFSSKPPKKMYWRAVRGLVPIRDARSIARRHGIWKAYKNGRGIVGALAAASWTPRDRTYEILTYRRQKRWGSKRRIDAESVIEMDKAFPSTFNNYDYLNRKVTISPSSPCPILFGIRAEDPDCLEAAMKAIRSESPERWFVFETNQGTDEHLVRPVGGVRPNTSVVLRGKVVGRPIVHRGGHVIFSLHHGVSTDCAAYEPSKQFRRVARALVPGDRIVVCGSVRDEPRTVNLEKLRILGLATLKRKVSNPACPSCRKRMKSVGWEAGFRCPTCRTRAPAKAAVWTSLPRPLAVGWYEPPVSARRHISKPLKRMGVIANPYPPP